MTGDYCLSQGYGEPGELCMECKAELSAFTVFGVGRLGLDGRLCTSCAEPSGLTSLVTGLEDLDSFVTYDSRGRAGLAAAVVMRCVEDVLNTRWLPAASAETAEADDRRSGRDPGAVAP